MLLILMKLFIYLDVGCPLSHKELAVRLERFSEI